MRFGDRFGFYELNSFPGCNQIVVSNHAFVYPEYRGQGMGHTQHRWRIKQMKVMGYDYAICTVVQDNQAQRRILRKAGWIQLDTFVNKETGNTVEIWGKVL